MQISVSYHNRKKLSRVLIWEISKIGKSQRIIFRSLKFPDNFKLFEYLEKFII